MDTNQGGTQSQESSSHLKTNSASSSACCRKSHNKAQQAPSAHPLLLAFLLPTTTASHCCDPEVHPTGKQTQKEINLLSCMGSFHRMLEGTWTQDFCFASLSSLVWRCSEQSPLLCQATHLCRSWCYLKDARTCNLQWQLPVTWRDDLVSPAFPNHLCSEIINTIS